MNQISKDSLGYLGLEFQIRLLALMVRDTKFANSIIEIMNPNYFEDDYLRKISGSLKDAYEQYEVILDMGALEIRVLESVNDEHQRKFLIKQLAKIKDASLNDALYIQEVALKFCKYQEIKKAMSDIQKIINKGNVEDYEVCQEILKKATEHGNVKDDGIDVLENIDDVLVDDFRKPIPTGIQGLDEVMDGGLSKGELGVILAPFGVGKTTIMTKFANTAKNYGYNVLQIFFEDMPKVIQRKHLACWSGIGLNSLSEHKELLKEIVATKKSEKGELKLKKFSSDGTTIPNIKQYVRKLMAQGFKPDIILLDYIDCVTPSKQFDDVNAGEGSVMRQFETMLAELDVAGWTAVQGNRSSIKAEVVEADQMGGSIKKGQIGHFILSIAKTLDQKENGTATMAILKSRFGKDGLIFQDITFDNAKIQIDMGKNKGGKTHGEHKKDNESMERQRINAIFEINKAKKQIINEDNQIQ
jgi:replicative DNA helicase